MENVVFAAMRFVLGQSRPPSVSEMGSQVKQVSAECVRFSRPARPRGSLPLESLLPLLPFSHPKMPVILMGRFSPLMAAGSPPDLPTS
jgi:hypothetical protein